MSHVFFTSDLHFGHAKVNEFEPSRNELGDTLAERDAELIERWNSVVTKYDKVYVLGDVVWPKNDPGKYLRKMTGNKVLIAGNHDTSRCHQFFGQVSGVTTYKGNVLTHIPIHPSEFYRWGFNIHGHLHSKAIQDHRYINVSVERWNFTPVEFTDLIERHKKAWNL